MAAQDTGYPLQFDVDYPAGQSRWKAVLRLPLAIPVVVFAGLLQIGAVLAVWAAILASARVPLWLFDFQAGVNRWQARAASNLLFLTDEYPAFEGDYPVQYECSHPARVSRWKLVIWKLVSSIPHLVVLFFLTVSLLPLTAIAWFAILIGARYPERMHKYDAGVLRWLARVQAYVQSLTDEFPPFSLAESAGSASQRTYVLSSVGGVLISGAVIAGGVTIALTQGETVTRQVSYADLLSGDFESDATRAHVISITTELTGAVDPAGDLFPALRPTEGHRFVQFTLNVEVTRPGDEVGVRARYFSLAGESGDKQQALLAIVGGRLAPLDLKKGDVSDIVLLFEVPTGVKPTELRYDVVNYSDWPRIGETIVYELD